MGSTGQHGPLALLFFLSWGWSTLVCPEYNPVITEMAGAHALGVTLRVVTTSVER